MLNIETSLLLIINLAVILLLGSVGAMIASRYLLAPLHAIWQAVLHIAPDRASAGAPNLQKIRIGRELVTSLTLQIYQFASHQDGQDQALKRKEMLQATNVVSRFPLPLFVFNRDQLVTQASDSAFEYCQIESSALFGKPIFSSLNLEFTSENTLESWIIECQQNKVTDKAYWQRVRVRSPQSKEVRQCDIAAYYNRDNPSGTEFIVILLDHSEDYAKDDEALAFVAVAVHELRTPLTMLRGYVEVFEDELGDKLDDELKGFMHKMRISVDQLAAFVGKILNVARIEENQLSMELVEQDWDKLLRQVGSDMELLAQVHDKTIEYRIEPGLPTVGADQVSIAQVISNLLDNAIKYGGKSKKIVLAAKLGKDGLVETTVQDYGVGIPTSVVPNLFEKFYRNHRTRGQIGGTGLGLYLSKAIVSAHDGHIWVKSKVDEGSTFGFTLKPYAQLAEELKSSNNTGITRQAHGWIKNHSLYRK